MSYICTLRRFACLNSNSTIKILWQITTELIEAQESSINSDEDNRGLHESI